MTVVGQSLAIRRVRRSLIAPVKWPRLCRRSEMPLPQAAGTALWIYVGAKRGGGVRGGAVLFWVSAAAEAPTGYT